MVGPGRNALLCVFLFFLVHGSFAIAQLSLDASLASDNVYRGISLNAGDPAAALNLTWDAGSGWYVGGMASQVHLYHRTQSSAQISANAGYAFRSDSGLGWEFGGATTAFPDSAHYNYGEVFAGLLGEHWNARLYISPDYFGRSERTIYAEFNTTHPLAEHLRWFAHVGALHGLSGARGNGNVPLYDVAIGTGARFGAFDLQVQWVDTSRLDYLYPAAAADTRHAWVASLTFSY